VLGLQAVGSFAACVSVSLYVSNRLYVSDSCIWGKWFLSEIL